MIDLSDLIETKLERVKFGEFKPGQRVRFTMGRQEFEGVVMGKATVNQKRASLYSESGIYELLAVDTERYGQVNINPAQAEAVVKVKVKKALSEAKRKERLLKAIFG